MSDRDPSRPSPDRSEPEVDIRVLRVEPGTRIVVRTLSNHYGGCFTHWKGGSKYCPGREDCQYHRLDKVWKGYACVEKYEQTANLWFPAVLEITEALELDLRGRWARGQVWELARERLGKKGSKPPVRGKLLEECDPNSFPAAFNLQPVLIWLFHVPEIRLDQQSPLPDRIRLAPSPGPAPQQRRAEDRPKMSAEEHARFRAELQKRMQAPAPSENGNGHKD